MGRFSSTLSCQCTNIRIPFEQIAFPSPMIPSAFSHPFALHYEDKKYTISSSFPERSTYLAATRGVKAVLVISKIRR